jgi:hypothetical protein
MLTVPSNVGFNEWVDIYKRMRNMQKATIYGLENKLYITCKILEDAMS